MKITFCAWSCCLALLLGTSVATADQSGLALADAFLQRHGAMQAARELSMAEKTSLGKALQVPNRKLDDHVISGLLKNPVAWRPGRDGRQLLSSIIHSLPEVAGVPGVSRALSSACNPNTSNFRGFGFEAIATAALHRYREPNGDQPRMLRMSSDVQGAGGKMLESDGCCTFSGCDRRQRLVTMKSVSSERALKGATKKAMSQLAKRNGSDQGRAAQPGIFMLGYSDPAVLESARHKNWRAMAARSRGKLLVLAVNQLNGEVTRLASVEPSSSPSRHGHRAAPGFAAAGTRPGGAVRRSTPRRWKPTPRRGVQRRGLGVR